MQNARIHVSVWQRYNYVERAQGKRMRTLIGTQ